MASAPITRQDQSDGAMGVLKFGRGLSQQPVEDISRIKQEARWMLDARLHALDAFEQKPMAAWGGDLIGFHFTEIVYYVKPAENRGRTGSRAEVVGRHGRPRRIRHHSVP